MNIEKDMQILAMSSEVAKELHKSGKEIIVQQVYINDDEDFTFHPNGHCGCVLLEDEYIFGIRCDHLIWMEGWCEIEAKGDSILVLGNHKGHTVTKLIYTK